MWDIFSVDFDRKVYLADGTTNIRTGAKLHEQ